MKDLRKSKLFIPIMGLLAGLANGLLGAGGGVLAVYAIKGQIPDIEERDVFANALCVMLPISAVSAIGYAIAGELQTDGLGAYALPAILGGVCGGILLERINARTLKKLFAAIVIYSGIALMLK